MEREKAKSFKDLVVWQKAHEFVLAVYRLTGSFPKEETYGLTSQLRRAAVSVAANIVEGFGKKTSSDKLRFLNYSQGSIEECRYYLLLGSDLGYGGSEEYEAKAEEVSKLLNGYMKAFDK